MRQECRSTLQAHHDTLGLGHHLVDGLEARSYAVVLLTSERARWRVP
jgi:hypothetical protein